MGYKSTRLEAVVRPVSIMLMAVQLSLFCAAIGLLIQQAIARLDIELSQQNLTLVFIVLVALSFFTLVNLPDTRAITKLLNAFPVHGKRLFFLACSGSIRRETVRSLQCFAVSREFRRWQIEHRPQTTIARCVVGHIANNDSGRLRYDAILGEAGSGKTRCALLVLELLIRDKTLCHLSHRCYYYDFALGQKTQELFTRRLGSITHRGAIVLVDNFHFASPATIATVTDELVRASAPVRERHIIFLAQPPSSWRLKASETVRLLAFAKDHSHYHVLRGLSGRELIESGAAIKDSTQWLHFAGAVEANLASIAQMHALQLDQITTGRDRNFAKYISGTLFSADEEQTTPPDRQLQKVLAVAVALSLHRGSFSLKQFQAAFWACSSKTTLKRILSLLGAWRLLQRLSRIGLIPKTSLPGGLYILHQRLAEDFRDRLEILMDEFEPTFRMAMQWRLGAREATRDELMQWLGAVELRDSNLLIRHFDSAMLEGGLAAMGRRLRANISRMTDATAQYQLGVIFDRAGEFSAAREVLGTVIDDPNAPQELKDLSRISRLEADHSQCSIESVKAIQTRSASEHIRISAEYWQLHMQAHGGVFNPAALSHLLGRMDLDAMDNREHGSYRKVALAGRIFFDACRHTYLRGEDITGGLQKLYNMPVAKMLQECEPAFGAHTTLYRFAHLSSLLVLPRLAIFGEGPTATEHALLGIDKPNLTALCELSMQLYETARDEFAVYGDRSEKYLLGDIINLKIQHPKCEPNEIAVDLAKYKSFIASSIPDISSYPNIYQFRLLLREWMNSLNAEYSKPMFRANEQFLEHAKLCLDEIERKDKQCKNKYGLWRLRLYRLLFSNLCDQKSGDRKNARSLVSDLQSLSVEARHAGYLGDAHFLNKLVETHLSLAKICNALIYHPFVHQ